MTHNDQSNDVRDTPIKGNVDRAPDYATSPEASGQNRSVRDSEIVDPGAETPSRAAAAGHAAGADALQRLGRELSERERGGADVFIEHGSADGDTVAPPSAHRADHMVRGVSGEARQQMERGNQQTNEPSFTKGANAPTMDQSRGLYTVEEMDQMLTQAPRGIFPDTPGGDGATPLSVERDTFLANMTERGRFDSDDETVRWARAVFNTIRERAIEHDNALAADFSDVIRVGEAPEVQVEEMMWGGDFLGRMQRALGVKSSWSVEDFYASVAAEAGTTPDDAWVDAAVHSFLGTLKSYLGDGGIASVGELQAVWDRV
jgi:uncharacterized protein (DUF2267 family)